MMPGLCDRPYHRVLVAPLGRTPQALKALLRVRLGKCLRSTLADGSNGKSLLTVARASSKFALRKLRLQLVRPL